MGKRKRITDEKSSLFSSLLEKYILHRQQNDPWYPILPTLSLLTSSRQLLKKKIKINLKQKPKKKLGLFRPRDFVFPGRECATQVGRFHVSDADVL